MKADAAAAPPLLSVLSGLLLATLLQGCAPLGPAAPAAERAGLQPPPQWLNSVDGGSDANEPQRGHGAVERGWWAGFGDPVLSALIEEALRRNLDLRLAGARLAEVRAMAEAQRGAELPTLDAGLGGARSRAISAALLKPYRSTDHQALFQAGYEVDLWGKVAALTQAAEANSAATRATRDAVALSVAATVASGYINLRALDAQLDLARQTLLSRERSLALTRAREQRGYGAALDSAQAAAEFHATAQAIPQFEAAARNQERAINVLLGQAPAPVERGLPLLGLGLRELPEAGLPSALLRRRPDIASAEWQLAAADAQWAAARAQLLPSLRLQASFGNVGSSVFSGDPFTIWSLGGSVLAPIFNGGRLRSLAEASASRRDQALIGYERAVLGSWAEVETQLQAFAGQRAQLQEAEKQRLALADALRIAGRRYREGYASYLDELLAQRSLFSAEQSVLQLRAALLITEVGLYRALGGGWSADE
ncbi:MAG: efflux transporter outer membrane subunit [Burkholderiaceae bacterium]